jgi:regulator of sigma E protease
VARLCGVKVEEFSLGFGPELFGFYDRKNTRWKFCLLPLGGYVKMYGDRNGASVPDDKIIALMSAEEKKQSFVSKNVFQRMAIVIAGPAANFILAILFFTFLFKVNGLNKILPVIEEVLPQSAAFAAKLQKGDEILTINDRKIEDFDQIRQAVISGSADRLLIKIRRGKKNFQVNIVPKIESRKDFFGDKLAVKTLGISASKILHQDLSLFQSFLTANKETYLVSAAVFKALKELITGRRSIKEMGGPIKIAQYSGKTFDMGLNAVIWFVAMISINLGVMNLLPIPVLDGGHLFFYIIEAICGKPLPQKVQKIGFQLGLSMTFMLMIFTTFNDIFQLIKF